MKYKLQQETKPRLSTFGKYKAVAVHQQTVGTKDITKECVEDKLPLLNEVIYKTALSRLSEVIKRHLRNGDKVCLEGIGMLKLEIESDKVDSPSDFKPKKHIRGVRLHFLPESRGGSPELYKDIKFELEK
jgi:nucleoid DNA-binding protein